MVNTFSFNQFYDLLMHHYYPKHKKALGQHFLNSLPVLEHIIEWINPHAEDHFLEIGPGAGILTHALAPHCKALKAIELDPDWAEYLQKKSNLASCYYLSTRYFEKQLK